jgi:hypothetical protein
MSETRPDDPRTDGSDEIEAPRNDHPFAKTDEVVDNDHPFSDEDADEPHERERPDGELLEG